ncbi:stalk domain-containing protein [Cytobacillus sp. Hz8]|uniref:stalk domain-containing protein n=1 Tax=Cytobacillus sp. Hz8 TaxID=3347168 RepID=UPI0035DE4691
MGYQCQPQLKRLLSKSAIIGNRTIISQAASYTKLKTIINGSTKSYKQPSIYKEKQVLVPMSSVFASFGAKVTHTSKTMTAVKGKTKVVVTLNSTKATVNGKSYVLPIKTQKCGTTLMVSYKLVNKMFGTTSHYSTTYKSVTFTTQKASNTVGGIKVKFGTHTYASKSQAEYDAVLKKMEEKMKYVDNISFGGEDYEQYYYEYLKGARWSGDKSDRSDRNVGLASAENALADLVSAKVSKSDMEKYIKYKCYLHK